MLHNWTWAAAAHPFHTTPCKISPGPSWFNLPTHSCQPVRVFSLTLWQLLVMKLRTVSILLLDWKSLVSKALATEPLYKKKKTTCAHVFNGNFIQGTPLLLCFFISYMRILFYDKVHYNQGLFMTHLQWINWFKETVTKELHHIHWRQSAFLSTIFVSYVRCGWL